MSGAIIIKIDGRIHFTLLFCKTRKALILEKTKAFIKEQYLQSNISSELEMKLEVGDKWGRNSWFINGQLAKLKEDVESFLIKEGFEKDIDIRKAHVDFGGKIELANKYNNYVVKFDVNKLC